jgi:hypothetical protein
MLCWWDSQKERDLDIDKRIILRWILEIYDGLVWSGLIWLRRGTGEEL